MPGDRQTQLRISEAIRSSEQDVLAQRREYRKRLAALDRLVVGETTPEDFIGLQER
jgi:hypothetical protein